MDVELELEPEWEKVRRWREQQLRDAGLDEFTAFRLALIPDLDLHKLVGYVRKGVPADVLIDMFID